MSNRAAFSVQSCAVYTFTVCYIRKLSSLTAGCYIGHVNTGVMAYADDIALLAPTATAMRVMLHVCENYAKEYSVVYNAAKSKCVVCASCTSLKSKSPTFSRDALFTINGNIIETADNWHHL